jgi:hypothetical protein
VASGAVLRDRPLAHLWARSDRGRRPGHPARSPRRPSGLACVPGRLTPSGRERLTEELEAIGFRGADRRVQRPTRKSTAMPPKSQTGSLSRTLVTTAYPGSRSRSPGCRSFWPPVLVQPTLTCRVPVDLQPRPSPYSSGRSYGQVEPQPTTGCHTCTCGPQPVSPKGIGCPNQ